MAVHEVELSLAGVVTMEIRHRAEGFLRRDLGGELDLVVGVFLLELGWLAIGGGAADFGLTLAVWGTAPQIRICSEGLVSCEDCSLNFGTTVPFSSSPSFMIAGFAAKWVTASALMVAGMSFSNNGDQNIGICVTLLELPSWSLMMRSAHEVFEPASQPTG
jgi:hypothetical protein